GWSQLMVLKRSGTSITERCMFINSSMSTFLKNLVANAAKSFFAPNFAPNLSKTTEINKNKNYKILVKIRFYSLYLFLYFISFRWQGTFLSL
ncbi:hypothetical protein, partial [Streptococcus salivarius]